MNIGSVKKRVKNYCLAALRLFKGYRDCSMVPHGQVNFSQLKGVSILTEKDYPVVNRIPPVTIDNEIYWKFNDLLTDRPQKTFVLMANGWRVWGDKGAVITATDCLFRDVSREFDKPVHSIFNEFKLAPIISLPGKTAVLNTSGGDMYYHWMFDILPRFKLLFDAGLKHQVDRYILDYWDLPFQAEALAALAIQPDKILKANGHFNFHIKAEHLYVPSLPSKLDVASGYACSFLRDTFLNKNDKSNFGTRIYLKRTEKRKLTNEVEIETYLQQQGFESVECEKYSIADQAAIFFNAEVIAGPHGAAFTNVVFCKPGTRVIEFFSPRWLNPCYWTICNELDLPYYYLLGEGPPPGEQANPLGTAADILLDLTKLKQLFNQFPILN